MQKISIVCDVCDLALTAEELSRPMRIDDKMYDLCFKCHQNLKVKLEGKGRPVLDLTPVIGPGFGYRWNLEPIVLPVPPNPCGSQVWIGDPPYTGSTTGTVGNICQGKVQCNS